MRLVESKAKLTPLDQKGEAVKAEMCGAVYAARLRKYIEKHCQVEIDQWFHLVDSQTVLGAIQRASYGYQSFFANRIGAIQRTTPVNDWWWIPSDLNIADIITRGGSPKDLKEDSVWQRGPVFLRWPVEDWPMKSAAEVAAAARESINKLQKKTFSAILTRRMAKEKQDVVLHKKLKVGVHEDREKSALNHLTVDSGTSADEKERRMDISSGRMFDGLIASKLLNPEKFSSLSRLVRVTAWVRRAVKKWLKIGTKTSGSSKWEVRLWREDSRNLS